MEGRSGVGMFREDSVFILIVSGGKEDTQLEIFLCLCPIQVIVESQFTT